MFVIRKCITLFAAGSLLFLFSCGSSENKPVPSADGGISKPSGTITEKEQTSAIQSAQNTGFLINGQKAMISTASDAVAGAQINAFNDQFSLFIFGDIVEGTKRGMLNISAANFNKKTGAISNAKASYTRYLDANGGKLVEYRSGKEGSFSITLTKCEQLPDGPVGEEWLVSGEFSGKMPVSVYYEKEAVDKELVFTEGKFTDLKLNVLGKKK